MIKLLRSQTRVPDEIVVAPSWDGTAKEASLQASWEGAAAGWTQFKVTPSTGYDNAATNRNRGARVATGEALAFWDADDVPHPKKLSLTMAVFASRPRTVLVLHGFRFTRVNNPSRVTFPAVPSDLAALTLRDNAWLNAKEKWGKPYVRNHPFSQGAAQYGWPTVLRWVALAYPYPEVDPNSKRHEFTPLLLGEDCLFVRGVAVHELPVVYVHAPLGLYFRRSKEQNRVQARYHKVAIAAEARKREEARRRRKGGG